MHETAGTSATLRHFIKRRLKGTVTLVLLYRYERTFLKALTSKLDVRASFHSCLLELLLHLDRSHSADLHAHIPLGRGKSSKWVDSIYGIRTTERSSIHPPTTSCEASGHRWCRRLVRSFGWEKIYWLVLKKLGRYTLGRVLHFYSIKWPIFYSSGTSKYFV